MFCHNDHFESTSWHDKTEKLADKCILFFRLCIFCLGVLFRSRAEPKRTLPMSLFCFHRGAAAFYPALALQTWNDRFTAIEMISIYFFLIRVIFASKKIHVFSWFLVRVQMKNCEGYTFAVLVRRCM